VYEPVAHADHGAAEHAHSADRFAREIVAILARSCAARLRRLMRNPLAALHQGCAK
jgi:hypothetical protein